MPNKPISDRAAGEVMLNEVFKVVEKLNATAGPNIAKKNVKDGIMTFSPKIVVDEDDDRQYSCDIEIYTEEDIDEGRQINVAFSGEDLEQFKLALQTVHLALSGLAQQGYLADTFTVGLVNPDDEEVEIYAPEVLEPGMYSLKDAYEEDEE